MKRVIVITSGKGGVGKTTCCANIGAALADLGNRVLLIDGDVGLRNLDLMLGLADDVVYDYGDVLRGNIKAEQALLKCQARGLYMIAAPQLADAGDITPDDMKQLCQAYAHDFDYIIIDSPAGIGRGFESAIAPADLAIVIATSDFVSSRDADRAIGILESAGTTAQMLLINKVRGDLIRKGKTLDIEEVIDIIGIDAIGIVPDDEKILECAQEFSLVTFDKKALAAQAFFNIARRIEGEAVPLIRLKRRHR